MKHEVSGELAKAAPPTVVVGASVAGVSLNDIILWATLIYLVLQIGFLARRWWKLETKE